MGVPIPPPPAPVAPPWLTFLTQYVAPTAIATVIAAGVSIYTAVGAAHEKQREYNTKFEELVTAKSISGAFGGRYVDTKAKTAQHDLDKESFEQSVLEQQATATLLSLQSVAESETQRRTVLLIGARLLNADPAYTSTGGPAARLLTVLIDQVRSGKESWNPGERHLNERLWDTINAQSFKDLVTAGYSSDYYNDPTDNPNLRPYWPTLNGDAPITTDPKFQMLWQLTPPDYDGWVHLATYAYTFPHGVAPRGSPRSAGQPVLTRRVAADFLEEVTDVTIRHNAANIGAIAAQYAIADPRASPAPRPGFVAKELIDPNTYPRNLIMLRHRLLRNRPPVQYINADGSFHKGSLGRILGAVAAGSCLTVVEPFEPVLVFLPTSVISPPATAAKPAAPQASGTVALGGLVHMWAHVRPAADVECLAVVNKRR